MNQRIVIVLMLTAALLVQCKKSSDLEDQRYTWSTDAPLTIPYRIRMQRFEKGNLVRNNSFETGRTFMLDNRRTSFVIDGWQQVGQHIQWVDTRQDSLYRPDEALSGYRSVRITRRNAYETDEQGDGIMSEFIKVIPGNYSLSFYVRLKEVLPVKVRLGVKMSDAIELNLHYYDRNKIEINPKQPFPQVHQFINTSFKSLSFANYSQVDSFGWGKIIGKSAQFPYPEGDIPTEAHYVRIFIGLKGKGTMWIDSVDFSYGGSNFSVAERMRQYTDTTYTALEAIIPCPKQYRKMGSVVFRRPDLDTEQQPLIIIPEHADKTLEKAASLIQEALQVPADRIVREAASGQAEHSVLAFSLGKTRLYREAEGHLPLQAIRQHPQGYFIHTTTDKTNLVFLDGNSSTAVYYAALTVIQLFDRKQPVFHNARIVDFPDFPNRYCTINEMTMADPGSGAGFTSELVRYKLNGAFCTADVCKNVASGQQPDGLFSVYSMPRFSKPDDSTLTYPYPAATGDQLSGCIQGFPVYPCLAVPALFHNQLLDYAGSRLGGAANGKDNKCIYAGCAYFSLNTDDADIRRFTDVYGTRPVFLDNSMQIFTPWAHYAGNDPWYPGKLRLYNIFGPYGHADIREYFSKLDTSLFIVNLAPVSEISIIRLATAADFMWNAAVYSEELSLWKVLQSRYGAQVARDLVTYADKYAQMLEMLAKQKSVKQTPRNLRSEQQILAELRLLVIAVGDRLGPDYGLVKELSAMNDEVKFLLQ